MYNLVWTHEWVCPSCMHASPSVEDCGAALVKRLEAAAVSAEDPQRAARALAIASSLASVIGA